MAHVDPKGMGGTEGANQPTRESGEPLLRTKLFIPPIRSKRVARADLIGRINNGLDKSLILVSAPAGFGKTTLLAEWVAQAGLPVGWLSLDTGDNDPNRFLRYVIAALNMALGGQEAPVCANALALLQSSVQPLSFQTILVAFINDLTAISKPFALVLDDYQFLTGPAANDALTFILERLPPQAHLVIASRVDPSLPLHRLRAAERLIEVRTEHLRFTLVEAHVFMNTVMGLDLSQEDTSILNARAEGWIVGLQMAALSMQTMKDRSAFIQGFCGSHRYILEYLIEEVLDRQSEGLQAFLLRTSILNRLCGPLCDAILEEANSQAILEYLDQSNLFLTPLDEVRYWYRYHHLFADLLRARLQRSQPESIHTLHLRASQWYEEAGLPEEAIQHAFAAKELQRAAELVEHSAIDILGRGEMSSLLSLFGALPEDLVLQRPRLCILNAWALTFAGQFEKAEALLQQVETRIRPDETTPESREILGGITILRSLLADYQGDMDSAIELALLADKLLPKRNWAERSIIPFVLGDGYSATGELDKAEQAFEKIKQIGHASGNLWTLSVALHKLALVKVMQGRLHQARDLYQEAILSASRRGGQQYGNMGAIYVGMSDLSREWNELAEARQAVIQAIKNMEHWPNPTNLVSGYVTLARIYLSEGEIERAEDALDKAEGIVRQGDIFPIIRKNLEACLVRLWLAKGDLASANRWAKEKQLEEEAPALDRKIDYVSETEWITMARVLLARNELDRALALLTTLAEAAEPAGRHGRLIEILILTAQCLQKSGKTAEAYSTLRRSLALAASEGYMRIFLDEGSPVEELLQACSRRVEASLQAYVEQLLHAFKVPTGAPADIPTSPCQPEPLIETLTSREIEVLHLLANGLSNREIAERLYLSEGTVKTHTHNLYGKLGIQSRTQAIARARELNLM